LESIPDGTTYDSVMRRTIGTLSFGVEKLAEALQRELEIALNALILE